jgi:hypothetical protein
MSAITESAKGEQCQVRIPSVCTGNSETVVWAHAIGLASGRGIGKKANDLAGAYACQKCHDCYDRRIRPYDVPYQRIKECFFDGHLRSLDILIEKGLVKF